MRAGPLVGSGPFENLDSLLATEDTWYDVAFQDFGVVAGDAPEAKGRKCKRGVVAAVLSRVALGAAASAVDVSVRCDELPAGDARFLESANSAPPPPTDAEVDAVLADVAPDARRSTPVVMASS